MGVPALFRWLNSKYPKITSSVIEESPDDPSIIINTALPNPNGFETDNLYLDMNGIIHPCCHSETHDAPATEEDMFMEIFKYTDRIFNMVRPRKLLYFAIDGVAPRAKMNQQRSRRFRAAQDASAKSAIAEKTREELIASGRLNIEPTKVSGNPGESSEEDVIVHPFDKNCITPGTKFMANLKLALEYYIIEKVSNDPGWKNIRVILSDSSVPGEGEHKIMSFIRHQKHSPAYNPNTRHVMYGLDADLIMLALATHEIHFKVLREDVFFEEAQKRNLCYRCQSPGHTADACTFVKQNEPIPSTNTASTIPKPFIYLDVYTLREYLYYEFRSDNFSPKSFSFERLIDDWIFLIFFVGNDFLPHLPSLEIHEGAIDMLLDIYKKNWTGKLESGYLTDEGFVDVKRVKALLSEIGKEEDIIFIKRKSKEDQYETNRKRRKLETCVIPTVSKTSSEESIQTEPVTVNATDENTRGTPPNTSMITVDAEGQEFIDDIRLWEQGAKGRYYLKKFDKTLPEDEYFVKEMTEAYIAGVCWVMAYYYRGCVSWNWYYPYHYAPFASDFELVDAGKKIEFTLGQPFRPFEQLLGVLPSASHQLLPEPYHQLMNDPLSELIDFYPLDFQVDLNGKKQAWKGVALLPFIEEERLLKAAKRIVPDLSAQDVVLNDFGEAVLYIHENHPDANIIAHLYAQPKEIRQGFTRLITEAQIESMQSINPFSIEAEYSRVEKYPLNPNSINNGNVKDLVDGWVQVLESDAPLPGASYHSRLSGLPVSTVPVNCALAALYLLPFYDKVLPFKARLMMGVGLPKATITQDDFLSAKQNRGNSYGRGRNQYSSPTSYGSGTRREYGELHAQAYHGYYREPSWKGNYQDRSYNYQRPYDRPPPYRRQEFDRSPASNYSYRSNISQNQDDTIFSSSREYHQQPRNTFSQHHSSVSSKESTGNRYEQYMDRLLAQGAPPFPLSQDNGTPSYPRAEQEKRARNYH